METGIAINIKYRIASDQGRNFTDLQGIDEFRRGLAADYVSVVKGRPAGAGGFTHLYVEVISSLSLSHLAQLLIDGIAFDLIKRGAESFVLRPFLAAYEKLRDRNKGKGSIDIGELQIHFQDSILLIHEVREDTIIPSLGKLLLSLAQNYDHLTLGDGQNPFLIHIPVFEDPDEDRPCRFRVRGDTDETIPSDGPADYCKFWGLEYTVETDRRVYDVTRQLLLDERFNTLHEHWSELTRRAESKHRNSRELEPSMKKPSPTESASAILDAKIRELGDWRGKMLAKVRDIIYEADPAIVEEWKWVKPTSAGVPVFSHGGIVCTGETYKSVVKMTFAKGAALKDPAGLFNSSLDGNVRRAIDIHEGDKIDEAALKDLIRAAVTLNLRGPTRVAVKKSKPKPRRARRLTSSKRAG